MTEMDKEVILTLAEKNMNLSESARSMFTHRNTVVYHVSRVKKITGLNPMNFYDLCKLVQLVKEGSFNG